MNNAASKSVAGLEPMKSVLPIQHSVDLPICPNCGSRMRLARISPHPIPTGVAEQITYDCSCGWSVARPLES